MNIEYDPAKAHSNLLKHGVSFAEASAVLFDDRALVMEDPDSNGKTGG
jgi:uncharacterized protein